MNTDGSITIEFAPHRVGLRVVVRGPGTFENTLAYWRSVAAMVRERHPEGLLLIDETSGAMQAAEWERLVESMRGAGLERVRIAHVKPHGLQEVEHCELYAREVGLDARVFTNEAEAALWLRYGERSASR